MLAAFWLAPPVANLSFPWRYDLGATAHGVLPGAAAQFGVRVDVFCCGPDGFGKMTVFFVGVRELYRFLFGGPDRFGELRLEFRGNDPPTLINLGFDLSTWAWLGLIAIGGKHPPIKKLRLIDNYGVNILCNWAPTLASCLKALCSNNDRQSVQCGVKIGLYFQVLAGRRVRKILTWPLGWIFNLGLLGVRCVVPLLVNKL